jgi:hypothetical protein
MKGFPIQPGSFSLKNLRQADVQSRLAMQMPVN